MAGYDQGQSSRLGQPLPVEDPGIQLVTIATIPEAPWDGMVIYRTDLTKFQVYSASEEAFLDPSDTTGNLTFVGESEPIADAVGDLWINTTGDFNTLYFWDGADWVLSADGAALDAAADAMAAAVDAANDAATAQAAADAAAILADSKITTFYQSSPPVSGMDTGDLWSDSDDNKLYRFNGTTWLAIQDAGIAAAIANAATAQTTADGKIVTFRQTSAPGTASEGDLWFDTDDANKVYRRTSGVWTTVQDTGIDAAAAAAVAATVAAAAAQSSADAAQATADGKTVTFYQTSTPVGGSTGDLWFRDTDNQAFRYNGTTWVNIQDAEIVQALADAATAQTTADGKIVTFYANLASPPTAEGVGDIWFVTDMDNQVRRWSGSAWVVLQAGSDAIANDSIGLDQLDTTIKLPTGMLSDGIVPSSSPAATVTPFAIGAVRVTWPATTNNDLVQYEVYASLTSPVSTSDEKVTVTTALSTTISRLGGVQIPTNAPVYVRIRARDADGVAASLGTEGSATAIQADNELISTLFLYAGAIQSNQVSAATLDAITAVLGTLTVGENITIAPPGVDAGGLLTGGITIKDPDNPTAEPLVRLHPNGCTFKGQVVTDILTVLQDLLINGDASLASGASLTLKNGVTNPEEGPVLTQGPIIDDSTWPGHSTSYVQKGICWDPTGRQWVEIFNRESDNVTMFRTVSSYGEASGLTVFNRSLSGILTGHSLAFKRMSSVCVLGTNVYTTAIYYDSSTGREAQVLHRASLATGGSNAQSIISTNPGNGSFECAVGTDGTNIFATCNDFSTMKVVKFTAACVYVGETTLTGGSYAFRYRFLSMSNLGYGSAKLTIAANDEAQVWALPAFTGDSVALDTTWGWDLVKTLDDGGLAYNTSGTISKSVTNKQLTSNVAILTATAHGFFVGERVTVSIGDPVFDGIQQITAIATNTFSFAKTNANVSSTAATGTAVAGQTAGFYSTHNDFQLSKWSDYYATAGEMFYVEYVDTGVSSTRTAPSPVTSLAVSRRRYVTATLRPAPAGVIGAEVYVGYGSSLPTSFYKRSETLSGRVLAFTSAKDLTGFVLKQVTVTNKALTSNVATLTSTAHGYLVGQSVIVNIADAVFNGTFTITAVAANTFSYAKTNANVTSAVTTGTATSIPVNTLGGTPAMLESEVGDAYIKGDGAAYIPGMLTAALRFEQNVAQSVSTGVGGQTTITNFNTANWSDLTSTISYSAGVFTVNRAGLYLVESALAWASATSGTLRRLYIQDSNGLSNQLDMLSTGAAMVMRSVAVIRLPASGTINLLGRQDSGGSLNTVAVATTISITRLSA